MCAGHVKPTTSPGVIFTTLTITLNEGDEQLHLDWFDDEEEDEYHNKSIHPPVDNASYCGSDINQAGPICDVTQVVCKVCCLNIFPSILILGALYVMLSLNLGQKV